MVSCSPYISSSHTCSHGRQLSGRPPESSSPSDTRVGTPPQSLSGPMPPMGHSDNGCLRHPTERQVHQLCVPSRDRPRVPRRRFHAPLAPSSSLHVPPSSTHSEGAGQAASIQDECHFHSSLLAPPDVVSHASQHVLRDVETPTTSRPPNPRCGRHFSPGRGQPEADCVEDLPQVREVLDRAKKPSTASLYKRKWCSFLKFTQDRDLIPSPVSLSTLLLYLRYLFDLNLALSTVRVYLAAIISFQPKESPSSRLFSHPTVKAFLKGLAHMRPPTKPPVPQWSLQLVLRALTRPPFEPMATCDVRLLTLKTLFLVAITSARRVSELAALRSDQPFLQFFRDKVLLYPDLSFLPKVVSEFHLNQPLSLPTLFPQPSSDVERMLHTLDVRRALAFYVSRTRDIRVSNRLFVCYFGHKKGSPAARSTLSRWIVNTIVLAYELQHKSPPDGLRAHSTRAVASSTAFLRGVDTPDICRAATWSTVSTFITHYRLDLRAKRDTVFGRAVLTSVLQ